MYSSIIRSQRFIKSFSSMSSTQSRFIVALSNVISFKPENKLVFLFSFSHEGEDSSSLVPNLEMVIPSVSFSLYSSCESLHGIVALKTQGGLILCNPSTEQAITVPPCLVSLFGYDPIDDQHKVVFGRSLSPHHELPGEHKVLTLGGGQGWRRIQVDFDYTVESPKEVCINGFVYFSAYSPTKPMNPCIVCFDVRSEKISYIKATRGCGLLAWDS
ncbi:putative F-box protein [Cardamine amara subsp. amara]|uniref:F-box protein n=1 Tax=Cardamine amara subsp. amara TaxID=228776 RepID=A0ABD1AE19_CARAN